jgi:hypothetical protein
MKKCFVIFFVTFILTNNISCIKEEKKAHEFLNLQWRDSQTGINESSIDDQIIIKFDTKNILENEIIEIEIWEQTDGKLMDLVRKLQGTVKNDAVEIIWIVEVDFNNTDTHYNREIDEKGYTLIDYVFLIKNGNEIVSSHLLAVTKNIDIFVAYEGSRKPIRNTEYFLIAPDKEYFYGKTDDDGYARIRKLRKMGNYLFFPKEE